MLKIVGLILIITASTLFGFFWSVKLKNRQLRLLKLCTFLEELEIQIKSGAELKNILLASGGEVGIYIEDFGVKVSPEHLLPKDIKLLEDFFSGLGMGDTESQIKRCSVYGLMLKNLEKSAAEQVNLKANLYQKLGFFAGLFVAVMFI